MKPNLYRILTVVVVVVVGMLLFPQGSTQADISPVFVPNLLERITNTTNTNTFFYGPTISGDGRYVAWVSTDALVPADTNGREDIYRYDRETGQIALVSITQNNTLSNGYSSTPQISNDGNLIYFQSTASNFVAGDNNGKDDIFVKNMTTGELTCLSVTGSGQIGNGSSLEPSLSSDNNYLVFRTRADNLVPGVSFDTDQIVMMNLTTHTIEVVSTTSDGTLGNSSSYQPDVSANGNFIVFTTRANNFAVDDTNNYPDIVVKDRTTGEATIISRDASGVIGDDESRSATIDDAGRFIAYITEAENIGPRRSTLFYYGIFYDRQTDTFEFLNFESGGTGFTRSVIVSPDGMSIAIGQKEWSIDDDTVDEIIVRDRVTGRKSLISVGHGYFSWSNDSRSLVFTSKSILTEGDVASTSDVFVAEDLLPLAPVLISPADQSLVDHGEVTYTWEKVEGVDKYTVDVRRISDDAEIHHVQYNAVDLCNDTTCAILVAGELTTGAYQWRVRSWEGEIGSNWSFHNTFTVTPEQTKLRSPGIDANVYGGRPTFRWYQDVDATSYMIEFYDPSDTLIGEWQKNPVCDPYCSYRIPGTMDMGSAYGDYDWRVRTITRGIAGPWSEMRTFTYPRLERTWQISPENGFTTADTTPTFEWAEITGATMYLFQIRLPDNSLVGNYLVRDADFCVDGGTCTWELTEDLPPGDYKWHVRAKNGRNFGRWTAYRDIIITSE